MELMLTRRRREVDGTLSLSEQKWLKKKEAGIKENKGIKGASSKKNKTQKNPPKWAGPALMLRPGGEQRLETEAAAS